MHLFSGMNHRAFSLRKTGPLKDQSSSYVELDFPEVTTKKAMAIKKSKDLSAVLGDPNEIKLGAFLSMQLPKIII
jgi:hypothetical protein